MMFVTNWIMAITAIVSSLIGFMFMGLILSKSQKYFIRSQQSLGNLKKNLDMWDNSDQNIFWVDNIMNILLLMKVGIILCMINKKN